MKNAAAIQQTVRAQRVWGVRAGVVCAVLYFGSSCWIWFREQAAADQLPSIALRAVLIFGVVNLFAFIVSIVYARIEAMQDTGNDEP